MNKLEELDYLKQRCISQAEHIEELRSTLDGLSGIRYDKDAVQSSVSADPMLAKICRIEDEEQKLTDMIVKYIRCRITVAQMINRMDVGKRQHLMRMFYLEEKNLEVCAVDLEWSLEYTRKELRQAVKDFENIPQLSL